MKRFLFFAVVATLFAACSKDALNEQQGIQNIVDEAPATLTVGFEDDETRIQLNEELKTVWTNGDLVSVFYHSNANQQWQYTGETGARTADLECVDAGEDGEQITRVVVLYPYNESYFFNTETFNVQTTLPAEQTYLADSYGLDGNIMVSSGEFNQFKLKTVYGWLKLQLTGNGEKIKSITVRGNNGEQVAGEAYINTTDATMTLAADKLTTDDDGEVSGSLIFEDTILKEVTLNCVDGVTLGAEATAFYVALPPQTFTKGITVEISTTDGETTTKSTDNEVVIERNHIKPMKAFAANLPVPETWKIYYTATAKVEPYDKTAFGATYVSNEWNSETKEGVITFDGDVTKIGVNAFNGYMLNSIRDNLTSITIPDSVTTIGNLAFYSCDNLAKFKGKFAKDEGRCLIIDDVFKAFACGCGVTEYNIPDGVQSIGYGAFYRASSLTTINFANSVKYIDGHAFQRTGIVNLVIPDHILSIGEYAFDFCDNLKSVTIGDGVGVIGSCAFYGCDSLTSVTIGRGVGSIGGDAFSSYNLKEVYCLSIVPPCSQYNIFYFDRTPKIYVYDEAYTAYKSAWSKYAEYIYKNGSNPDTSTITIEYTTSDNQIITPTGLSVKSNEYVDGVGTMVVKGTVISGFTDATTLVSINIPNGVSCISPYTFDGCVNLTSVTFGNSVGSVIGDYAFRNCDSLTSVTIPDSVTTIGYEAFNDCAILTSVTIPDSVTTIGDYAFKNCDSLTSVTIPDRVTTIGKWAFSDCDNLTSVTIPDGVTTIGERAFYSCDRLTSVTIPDSVTTIGKHAFWYCKSLTSVNIPDRVTTIEQYPFSGCTKLTSVTIPDRVTTIGNFAFSGCSSLTSVTIGNSVTTIGRDAFSDCGSLKTVYCKPTTPPTGGSGMFDGNASDRKIYVPASADDSIINAYKVKQYWSSYADYIEEDASL